MKKIIAAAVGLSLALLSSAAFAEGPKVGVVVKIGGIPWFNAMEAGIKEQSNKLGVDGFMVGPTSADPALQVRAIEDLIAQKVDFIGVVPNDAKVLEPVLKKPRPPVSRSSPMNPRSSLAPIGILSWRPPRASVKRMASCWEKRWAARVLMPSSSVR